MSPEENAYQHVAVAMLAAIEAWSARTLGLEPERRNADGRRSPWRSPGDAGGSLAEWLDAAQGQNGVYLIRDARSRDVLYIGESHRERLKKTLTRHFQIWQGVGSGPTFDRHTVEVAIELYADGPTAKRRQFALIRKYDPPYNVQDGRSLPEDDGVPF